jgi:NADH:ubiquinone oxidoreductase subunit F (NADH-binding)
MIALRSRSPRRGGALASPPQRLELPGDERAAVAVAATISVPTLRRGPAGTARLLPPEHLALPDFVDVYGMRPAVDSALIDEIAASGLVGRGGAGFPTTTKLRSVRQRPPTVVVANGVEGEPISVKDKALLIRNPHLVIDGALIAAELVGAREVVIAIARGSDAPTVVANALEERRDARKVRIATLPDRFVAGEETAVIHWINDGDARPTLTPPRPFERGVNGRPTLVQNVETLAHLALVARYGASWFRRVGTDAEPGTVLATVSGAVHEPGVIEVALGTAIVDVLDRCGGVSAPVDAYLVGGYFGRWVAAEPEIRLSRESLRTAGGVLGAAGVVALSRSRCGVVETARVASYMASESAEQCGPCVFGLRTLAQRLEQIARLETDAREAFAQVGSLQAQIAKRGACAHPDGTLGFVMSALGVFADEFRLHLNGHCSASDVEPVLPVPTLAAGWR